MCEDDLKCLISFLLRKDFGRKLKMCNFFVTLLNSLSFPSTCIHSHNKDVSIVVFASAARAALLAEQMCSLKEEFCTP
jgi:hypothetical protein